MTTDRCAEIRFLLQADVDGELEAGGSALVAAHLAQCSACAAEQANISALSARLRAEVPYHAAPAGLRLAIETAVANAQAPAPPAPAIARHWRSWLGGGWKDRFPAFGAGIAVAATVALLLVVPRGGTIADSVVENHIRALQPGHLMDVVSTDQHTVKPWFDGRLDYAPPVKDLAARGFPLIGGRLDYLAGRPVAALAYRRDKHLIDLYVWPRSSGVAAPGGRGTRDGYHYVRWSDGEMVFWAVSDLNQAELDQFSDLWRAMK